MTDHLAQVLGPPKATPSVCGFGDCQDDDKDAPQQTTLWEFDPGTAAGNFDKGKDLSGIVIVKRRRTGRDRGNINERSWPQREEGL